MAVTEAARKKFLCPPKNTSFDPSETLLFLVFIIVVVVVVVVAVRGAK